LGQHRHGPKRVDPDHCERAPAAVRRPPAPPGPHPATTPTLVTLATATPSQSPCLPLPPTRRITMITNYGCSTKGRLKAVGDGSEHHFQGRWPPADARRRRFPRGDGSTASQPLSLHPPNDVAVGGRVGDGTDPAGHPPAPVPTGRSAPRHNEPGNIPLRQRSRSDSRQQRNSASTNLCHLRERGFCRVRAASPTRACWVDERRQGGPVAVAMVHRRSATRPGPGGRRPHRGGAGSFTCWQGRISELAE
jgi:hypothetical protein